MASCHPSCTSDLYLLLEVQCQHSYVSYHYTRLTWVINLEASFFTKLIRPAALLAGSKEGPENTRKVPAVGNNLRPLNTLVTYAGLPLNP